MRVFLGCILAIALSVLPTGAAASGEGNSSSADAMASDVSTGKASAGLTAKTEAAPEPLKSSLESEIEELRDLLETQAQQLKDQQQKMQLLEEQLKASNTAQEPEDVSAAPTSIAVLGASSPSFAISASAPAAQPAAAVQPTPAPQSVPDSPLQFRIGSAYLTPFGFMDFTGVFRNHNAGGGIWSNFGNIPYEFPTSATGVNLLNHVSEARLSIQNSRIGFRADALVKGAHVIGYFEGDFLGNNPSNVAVSSNSNTFRSRLYWVDLRKGKLEILGGQTWSLITAGRTGISPLPGDVFVALDTDVNYQTGYVWGRIPEFRFVYHPSSKAAIAFAFDNQEQYWGGSAGGPTPLLPSAGPTTVNGVLTLPGTQLNNQTTTTNAPQPFFDVIVKVALDPSPKLHFEFGGVERQFRVAVNSTTSPSSPVVNQRTSGGGAFVNLNVQLFKGFRLLTNNYWSQGGGRYMYGLVPDVILNPDGSMSAIRASSTLSGFEYTHKTTLVYAYYGGIYAFRDLGFVNGLEYGYGVDATGPGSNYTAAITQNRAQQESTIGFNQTIWRDAKYGALNLMGQYSYLTRAPWSVAPGNPTQASLQLGFFNLRYTLPGAAPAASALK